MVLGRHKRFLQSLRSNELRAVKLPMEDGNTSIVVPFKESFFKPSRFPRFSGKLTKFEHQKRQILNSDFKLQMVLGRHTNFLQLVSSNELRVVKLPMEVGNTSIAVPFKEISLKPSRFPKFSSKLTKFEHPERQILNSDFKIQMEFGRNIKFLQSVRSNEIRPIKNSTDKGISFIAVPPKMSLLRLTIFPKSSGNLSNFEHPKRSRHVSDVKLQIVFESSISV